MSRPTPCRSSLWLSPDAPSARKKIACSVSVLHVQQGRQIISAEEIQGNRLAAVAPKIARNLLGDKEGGYRLSRIAIRVSIPIFTIDTQQLANFNDKSGLLRHFANCGLSYGFAQLNGPSGEAPDVSLPITTALQKHLSVAVKNRAPSEVKNNLAMPDPIAKPPNIVHRTLSF